MSTTTMENLRFVEITLEPGRETQLAVDLEMAGLRIRDVREGTLKLLISYLEGEELKSAHDVLDRHGVSKAALPPVENND